MSDDFLKNTGKFVVIGLVVAGLLYLAGWKVSQVEVGPIVFDPPDTLTSSTDSVAISTITFTPVFFDTTAVPTNTFIPVSEDWFKEGVGNVNASDSFVSINTDQRVNLYNLDDQFHNLFVSLRIYVKRLDKQGYYSVFLRRVDPCQLYEVRFSERKDVSFMRIEFFKYFCNEGYTHLNYADTLFDVYQPHLTTISISGGSEVYFLVEVDGAEALRVRDDDGFIWRGNFGLSVSNGEVEFADIALNEK